MLIEAVIVLAIVGFALWLLLRYVPMQPPFPQIIAFVVVLAVVLWLLDGFGVWHMGIHHGRF